MRKLMPISSAVVALIITSALSGCGGTSVEPVTGPTTRTDAAQTSNAAQTTDSAAATAKASATAAVKAAEGAAVAKAAEAAKVAQAKTAAGAKAAAAAKAVTITENNDPGASPTAPLPTQSSATLRETCSKVEKAVSGLTGKSSGPTAPVLDAALAQVKLLNGSGDTQTRNALSALLETLPGYRDENPTGVANDGRRAFLDSLASLADRCKAVGSSALQWVG